MSFQAIVLEKNNDQVDITKKELSLDDLLEGEVTIRVAYSSVNYKDGLAAQNKSSIVTNYPMIPGIDLSGTVSHSSSPDFQEGDEVLVTGYKLGVSHFGGYSEYARVPAEWVVPLPEGLTFKDAMLYGTAGFTAALSVHRLQEHGITPESGSVIVTGATGGVGSQAVAMLSNLGYRVTASTGKESEHSYLKELGASDIIDRDEVVKKDNRPLYSQRWAAAVDPVGGKTLEFLLSSIQYGGSVAVSGLTGGTDVHTTVHPFILRGINLLGIDSVFCPAPVRNTIWERIATDLKTEHAADKMGQEVTLDELPDILRATVEGNNKGRVIVKVQ
ncbi:putative quinone oxidoreductase, YhdH/YhfP family [Fictibacillus enclensis]|uniref:Quinone oxidoreductase n=1 Tax=Fictibacillus enclensis TaxID=1017270 RepID=A0A0V8J9R6_9BACL|nr:acryloyl-CoA reductase [Fictibacillus enclensis]KSU83392.1 quinone oxidoreductase [Fictibacillus enclensis]SCC14817.1 putative quinone oxidoreductase, YhdH/YhfP family [Fictibacillus enclensis]